MSEKIYCGKGKKSNYGIKMSICLSDIPQEHITESKGKKYVRLELKERKSADQYGNTHFVTVDTWKPQSQQPVAPAPQHGAEDDLPF